MDLGSSLFSVICLLGAALCANGDNISCPCPNIPTLALTEPPLNSCHQIDDIYRYTCKEGYKRKVGTSNLIKCKQEGGSPKWSTPTLECKADPNRPPPTQPPKSTVTNNISCPCPNIPTLALTEPPLNSCHQIDDIYRYTCKEGYKRKVGTSNLIKCKQEGGSPKWSTPTLECKADPNRPPPTQPPKSTVTNIPTGTIIITSVTASTCQQTIQSISTAAPGLQAQTDHSQAPIIETETTGTTGTTGTPGTTGTHRTTSTSTTTEPSSNSTISVSSAPTGIGRTTTAGIGCASLAFVLALIGITLYCYKRKSRNSIPPEPTEELLYLNAEGRTCVQVLVPDNRQL